MEPKTLKKIEALLKPYEKLPLECDGFSRVAHYVLQKNNIPHHCFVGSATVNQYHMQTHFWIELQDGYIVDYKLQMWFNNEVPYGVFQKTRKVQYIGKEIDLKCDEMFFKVLTTLFNRENSPFI